MQKTYTERLARPMLRRLLRTFRPEGVSIRDMKPCLRALLSFFG